MLNDPDFFNPHVRIDNSVSVELVQGDSDRFPKIKRLVSAPKDCARGDAEVVEVPWLSKMLRFKGTLVSMDMDAKCRGRCAKCAEN